MAHIDDARVADLIARLGDGDARDLFRELYLWPWTIHAARPEARSVDAAWTGLGSGADPVSPDPG